MNRAESREADAAESVQNRVVGRAPSGVELLERVERRPILIRRPFYERAKRGFDLALCLLAAPVALLLIGACAVAILLSEGRPIFFVQKRTGRGGRRFDMYKFRTMVPEASALKHCFAHLNELSGPDFKISDDPRVTRLGAVLRRTSLDEVPQLWNVVRGDMSLVGPRPTSFAANTYSVWQTERLEVVPGITGLWQVSGRSDIDFDERVRLDVAYIERRGFAFDLMILVRTLSAVVGQSGAR